MAFILRKVGGGSYLRGEDYLRGVEETESVSLDFAIALPVITQSFEIEATPPLFSSTFDLVLPSLTIDFLISYNIRQVDFALTLPSIQTNFSLHASNSIDLGESTASSISSSSGFLNIRYSLSDSIASVSSTSATLSIESNVSLSCHVSSVSNTYGSLNFTAAYPIAGRDLGGVGLGYLNNSIVQWAYFVRINIPDPYGPLYLTDHYESVTGHNIGGWGTEIEWDAETRGLEIKGLSESMNNPLNVSYLNIHNLDRHFTYASNAVGLRRCDIDIYVAEFDPYTGDYLGSYKRFGGEIDDHTLSSLATLNLKPHNTPWGHAWLGWGMSPSCHNIYRGPYCKYAGEEPIGQVTCLHRREDCDDRNNLLNFNGFDLGPRPNEEIKWGVV